MARLRQPAYFESLWLWIPGSTLTRRPGMTTEKAHLAAATFIPENSGAPVGRMPRTGLIW